MQSMKNPFRACLYAFLSRKGSSDVKVGLSIRNHLWMLALWMVEGISTNLMQQLP
ncbi:hypothetical protein IAD21_00307 [Abditibacteriota bacterium]|nr:hypothetical protein IAD21_00307 [Abditibacteriota bacterium]